MSDAKQSSTFSIGGALKVQRLGYGAMRITGRGIWGAPADRAEALRVLKRRPEYLIQQALKSRRNLGVETIDLWQLHRIDPKVPRGEQFDAIRSLIADKVVRFVGLSEVSVEEIEAASKTFPVATVQNRYNLDDRSHEKVLDACTRDGLAFLRDGAPILEEAGFGVLAPPWWRSSKARLGLRLRARTGSIMDLEGCIPKPEHPVSIEEMDRAVLDYAAQLDAATRSDADGSLSDGEAA